MAFRIYIWLVLSVVLAGVTFFLMLLRNEQRHSGAATAEINSARVEQPEGRLTKEQLLSRFTQSLNHKAYARQATAEAHTVSPSDVPAALESVRSLMQKNDEDGDRNLMFALATTENVPALRAALKHKDFIIRHTAAAVLGIIGPEAGAAIPDLIECLKDPYEIVRGTSATALGRITIDEFAITVPALRHALSDKDAAVRLRAADSLDRFGADAKDAVPELVAALKDPDDEVRAAAASALAAIGSEATAAVPALAEALKDSDTVVRVKAADALAKIGPAAQAVAPELCGALRDNTTVVRLSVVIALMQIMPIKRDYVSDIVLLLQNDPEVLVRSQAAIALGKTKEASIAVPALIQALNDKESRVGQAAAESLAEFGPEAKSAVAALLDAKKGHVGLAAVRALKSIEPAVLNPEGRKAVDALIEQLKNPNEMERLDAVLKLRHIGPDAVAAIPGLLEVIKNKQKEDFVREAAASVLADLGPSAKQSVAALLVILSNDKKARTYLIDCLDKIDRNRDDVLVVLIRTFEANKDEPDRIAILNALRRYGPKAKAAVPLLIKTFKEEPRNSIIRELSAEILYLIDANAAKANRVPKRGL